MPERGDLEALMFRESSPYRSTRSGEMISQWKSYFERDKEGEVGNEFDERGVLEAPDGGGLESLYFLEGPRWEGGGG